MKKLLVVLLVAFANLLMSQDYSIDVTDHTGIVGKMHHAAIAVVINLDKDEVRDSWKKELKNFGKVETSSGAYKIEQASIKQVNSSPVRVLSKVETSSQGTRIWVSINTGEEYVKSGGKGFNGIKTILEDFAKKLYLEDIERQVGDAEKALIEAQKNQERVISTGDQFEKDLIKNEEEHQELEQSIEQNVQDQEAATQSVTDMEKALLLVRAKVDQVK